MKRYVISLLACLPAALQGQAAVRASAAAPEIVATGSAEVRLRPDRARMTVSVMVRSRSATESSRINGERMDAVIATLRRQGVPDTSMATTGFSIEIEEAAYDQPAPPTDAPPVYVANNAVSVSLTDLESIGRVVDSVLAAGASGVWGIAYSSTESTTGRRRAIALAVAEARGDAEAAAEAAGGRLGPLIELTMAQSYGIRGAAAASLYQGIERAKVPLLVPTSIAESASVIVRFAFVPRR